VAVGPTYRLAAKDPARDVSCAKETTELVDRYRLGSPAFSFQRLLSG